MIEFTANFSALIGHLYDAAIDTTLWTGISSRVAEALDATSGVVKFLGAHEEVQLLDMTPNMQVADKLQDWALHWHNRDLWAQRSIAVGLSRIVTGDQLVTAHEMQTSGFYQEWLNALDIHHVIGAVFPAAGGAIGVLGVHRPAEAENFDSRDRHVVATLLPHLERALRIGQRVREADLAAAHALDGMEALDTGMVILDAAGRVLHMNAVARGILADSDRFFIQHGRFCADRPREQEWLAMSLSSAIALASGRGSEVLLPLRIDRPDRTPWSLTCAPLGEQQALAQGEARALVLLRDPEFPPMRIDHLRALFGLTRMEALTAAELARGRTVAEIAASLGLGIGTVRSHLKQVLHKTETNRQAEAVAVISRSIAVLPVA